MSDRFKKRVVENYPAIRAFNRVSPGGYGGTIAVTRTRQQLRSAIDAPRSHEEAAKKKVGTLTPNVECWQPQWTALCTARRRGAEASSVPLAYCLVLFRLWHD